MLLHVFGQAGSLDQNFAGKGWTTMPFALSGNANKETATQLLRQANGGYILSIYLWDKDYTVLTRYDEKGSIDSSFGKNGFSDPINLDQSLFYEAKCAALQMVNGDEKIVVTGIFRNTNNPGDFGLTRFNSNGTLDKTFGTGGTVTTDFYGDADEPRAIAVQNYDNKILVAGLAMNGYADFALARYHADGSLDTDFGGGGKLTMDFNSDVDYATCILVQSDHKILLGGTANNWSGSWDDFGLVRYDNTGALDTDFGIGGKLTTDFNANSSDMAEAMAIQTIDGADKIVVAGKTWTSTGYDFAVARYNIDGSPDISFDTDGKITTSFGINSDEAYTVAVQPGNKIIVAGVAYVSGSENFGLVRYNINGSLDTGFGTNGLLAFRFGNYSARANAILLDGENMMVTGSASIDGWDSNFALLCLDSGGGLVSGFGTGGAVTGYYESNLNSFIKAIALQNVNGENKILVAGSSNDRFALARRNADGSPDKTFGTDGNVFTYFSGPGEAEAIAIQNINGVDKIIAAGVDEDWESGDSTGAIARYNADGALDESFGYSGKTNAGILVATCLAIQADNKILVAGQVPVYNIADSSLAYDFGVVRFNANGHLDSTFGTNGIVITGFFGYADSATSIAIQPDGKIIVAGKAVNASGNSDFALARYTIEGALDGSFGNGGKFTTDFNGDNDAALYVAVQPNGKIIVTGFEVGGGSQNFAAARYTSKGKLDITFGSAGKLITDFDAHNDVAYTLALQNDGKILVAGSTGINQPGTGFQNDLALARYSTAGALDISFGAGSNGKVTSDFGYGEVISSSAVKNDKLYVAGTAFSTAGFAVPNSTGIIAVYETAAKTPPVVTINDISVNEGDTAKLTVSLDKICSSDVTVNYATQDVTATTKGKNADYKAARGSIVISTGQASGEIKIATYGDNQTMESNETFNVNLTLPNQTASLVTMGDATGVVTINNVAALVDNARTLLNLPGQNEALTNGLSVKVIPNPSYGYFTLQLQSELNTIVNLQVTDASGKIIETKKGISANGSLQIGNEYRPGVYYVEINGANRKISLKLIKL